MLVRQALEDDVTDAEPEKRRVAREPRERGVLRTEVSSKAPGRAEQNGRLTTRA